MLLMLRHLGKVQGTLHIARFRRVKVMVFRSIVLLADAVCGPSATEVGFGSWTDKLLSSQPTEGCNTTALP